MGSATLQYWRQRNHFSSRAPPHIDWNAVADTSKMQPFNRKIFWTKLLSNHLPTNVVMHRRGQSSSDMCIRCHSNRETSTHLLQCPAPSAQQVWATSIITLQGVLKKLQTSPDIATLALRAVTEWTANRLVLIQPSDSHVIRQLHIAQSRIGWENFLLGRWHHRWLDYQGQYLALKESRRSPKRWLTAVLRKLQDIAWDQWTHRNGLLHGPNGAAEQETRQALLDSITQQYRLGSATLRPQDKYLLDIACSTVQAYDIDQQRQWLATIEASRAATIAAAQQPRPPTATAAVLQQWLRPN
jgi:hypothetical protein